jgi:high-affinity nickel-transport protein
MDLGVLGLARADGLRGGLVVAAFGFGFRHGIDWDHIAAITDIAGSERNRRRSMLFATLYALGHGLVVLVLGLAAIVLAARLPDGVDTAMERVVGATLLALGVYVLVSLVRDGRDFRMRSRWMLVLSAMRGGWLRLRARHEVELVEIEHDHPHPADEAHVDQPAAGAAVAGGARVEAHDHGGPTHRHVHRHIVRVPADPFVGYRKATAFAVGMVHGIGAETPTQVLVFLAAAGAGGKAAGVALLVCFLAGLLLSNTLVALAASAGYLGAARNFRVYVGVSVVTAAFSLVVGSVFLLGRGAALPTILGG